MSLLKRVNVLDAIYATRVVQEKIWKRKNKELTLREQLREAKEVRKHKKNKYNIP